MSENKVLDGLFGVCVADALGVPVEFEGREDLKENPITGMTEGGTWNQPAGTYSDDGSLTLCLADSLCYGYNLHDIADTFVQWKYKGLWASHGQAFDVGGTTARAISQLNQGTSPLKSGQTSITSNGNGSLMRNLPIIYHIKNMPVKERFEKVKEVSSITHAHPQSVISCQIYTEILNNILKGDNIKTSYEKMIPVVQDFHKGKERLQPFDRILKQDISQLPEDKISSRGYVISSLEAALWCNLNSNSFEEAALKAVNLGDDTDTVGAITGGIAGLYYGAENIPKEWIEQLARKQDIIELSKRLNTKITKK